MLLGLCMPDMDGTTLLKRLASEPPLRRIPTVVMTGTVPPQLAAELAMTKPDPPIALLMKPFTSAQLLSAVSERAPSTERAS